MPGPDQDPAPPGVIFAETRCVKRILRVLLDNLLLDGQAGVESGQSLGKALLAGEQPAKLDVAPGQVVLIFGDGGVDVSQFLEDGQCPAGRPETTWGFPVRDSVSPVLPRLRGHGALKFGDGGVGVCQLLPNGKHLLVRLQAPPRLPRLVQHVADIVVASGQAVLEVGDAGVGVRQLLEEGLRFWYAPGASAGFPVLTSRIPML